MGPVAASLRLKTLNDNPKISMGIFHEYILFPLSGLIKGENTFKYFHFLKKTEKWTAQEIEHYQDKRLKMLIDYAERNVHYYHNAFKRYGISSNDINSKLDLSKLPIVDKSIMKKEGIDMFVSKSFPKTKRQFSRSSGSTGEPFSFYVSKKAVAINTAAKLRTWYHTGYKLGDKYMKIANGKRKGIWKRIQDYFNNCIFIPFEFLDETKIKEILNIIEVKRPMYIRSYPAPLYLLAQYRNNHDCYSYCPKCIMTTGSTLSQEYRMEIQSAFGCDIIDSYSCEGTPNTYETVEHNGYKVTGAYGIIEVLDENDKVISNGIGRVVSTDLWNFAHPFIRYDTHDLVEVHNGRIVRIIGRECETYVVSGGTRYTVHNFSRFFLHDLHTVEAYQIVKKSNIEEIVFRLVVSKAFSVQDSEHIIDFWSKRLQKTVCIEIVKDIPLMKNNKRLTIVSE